MPSSFPVLRALAKLDRQFPRLKILPVALASTFFLHPKWKKYALLVLKESFGTTLPNKANVAVVLWSAAHMYAKKYPEEVRRTGLKGNVYALGEALFSKLLNSPSGTVISKHRHEDHWNLIRHKDKKVHLAIPEMLEWLDTLPEKNLADEEKRSTYPFNLIAGERRSYNANAILRNPDWRKTDKEGVLKIHPVDAEKLGVKSGSFVNCSSETGTIRILVKVTEEVPEGTLSMPHGYGLQYPGEEESDRIGAMANLLTSVDDCDPLAKTPYHTNVAVRLELA